MESRLEYKYLVPVEYLDDLRAALEPFVSPDSFSKFRNPPEYTVRSIYFDTPDMEYYFEKVEGLKVRKKLRIRGYNELCGEKVIFLEIKRKYENFISKNRSPILYDDLSDLLTTGNIEDYVLTNKLNDALTKDGKRFLFHLYSKSLRPTVLVTYDREAFFMNFDPRVRITFDKNLRYLPFPSMKNLYDEEGLQRPMPYHFILEIKFQKGFPKWLQQVITNFSIRRMAISKYTISLDHDTSYVKPINPIFRNSFFDIYKK